MLNCNRSSLNDKISQFSAFGATKNGGVTRLTLSDEDIAARDFIIDFCQSKDLITRVDDLGNIYATLKGTDGSKAILSGSHCDSVINGGNYDGILGVISAMETIDTLLANHVQLAHDFTLVVWTNEEGVRFPPAMMSSGIITGEFTKETMFKVEDREGITFGEALAESSFQGGFENRLVPNDAKAYLELHIEQGPILEANQNDIGIVEGVVGMVNYDFIVRGQADHAGTTPMRYRQDALVTAAKLLLQLHEAFSGLADDLVFTFGEISAHPNLHTVIPDYVKFSLDARHKDAEVIQQVVDIINHLPQTINQCQIEAIENWARNTVYFNPSLVNAVSDVTKDLNYSNQRLYSGAGHDAQYISKIVPTTMIFVPSKDGHSHCEIEYTSLEQCAKGIDVLLNTVILIDRIAD